MIFWITVPCVESHMALQYVDHLRCISISTITLQQIQHPGKVGYSEIPLARTIQEQGFINAFEAGQVHIHLDHPTPSSESLWCLPHLCMGFPGGSAGRVRLQWGRPGFYPWVGKIPWRRERLLTPILWPGEFHRLYSRWGCKELDTSEWLSLSSLCN